jgi:hypothetical protein
MPTGAKIANFSWAYNTREKGGEATRVTLPNHRVVWLECAHRHWNQPTGNQRCQYFGTLCCRLDSKLHMTGWGLSSYAFTSSLLSSQELITVSCPEPVQSNRLLLRDLFVEDAFKHVRISAKSLLKRFARLSFRLYARNVTVTVYGVVSHRASDTLQPLRICCASPPAF